MKGKSGFTLIELLIALAVFSIIVSALYSTFFVARKSVDYTEESLLGLHEMRTLMRDMQREIEASFASDEEGEFFELLDRDYYGKQASSLSFNTFGTALEADARVSYHVLEEEPTGRLRLMKKVHYSWDEGADAREAEALEDIVSFDIQAKAAEDAGEGGWVSTWNEVEAPKQLRVSITVEVGGRPVTLFQTVRPRKGDSA